MKVDAGTGVHHVSQPARGLSSGRSATTSFAAALAATQAEGAGPARGASQPDFSSMTRRDMRDWVNGMVRSGEMSLDDSRPFMAMTMKIPAGAAAGAVLAAENDTTRYDFTQLASDGIQGALSRNDQTTLKMLETAMSIMLGGQGRTAGVDTRA